MKKMVKKIFSLFKKNIKNLIKNINIIHNKTDNLRLFILFDIIWCKIRYMINSNEYRIFEFYLLNSTKRKTYLSSKKYNLISSFMIDEKLLNVINDKKKLNVRFNNILNREVYNSEKLSFKQFEELVHEKNKVICRNNKKSFMNSFEVLDLKNFRSPAWLLDKMKKDNNHIFECYFNQHKLLNKISDNLVVINIVTVFRRKANILTANIKFKDNDEIISSVIDLNKSCTIGHLRYENGEIFKEENNLELPSLDKCVNMVLECAKELSEIPIIEWSLCINSRGNVYLMDANIWDDVVFSQIPEYLSKREGLLPLLKRILKKRKV